MSDPHSSQNLFELSPSGLFSGPRESTAQLIPKNAIADLTWLLQSYSRTNDKKQSKFMRFVPLAM